MARILFVTQFFPPETGAAARRAGAMAQALAADLDLGVVTLQPSYPTPDAFRGQQVEESDSQFPFTIKRIGHFPPYRSSLVQRGLAETRMALRMAAAALGEQFEALLVTTPSMFLIPVLFPLARAKGADFIWDLRDLTWRYVAETGSGSLLEQALSRLLEIVMAVLLRSSDLVIVTNDGARTTLLSDYELAPEKVVTLTNGVSVDFFEHFGPPPTALNHPPVVLYLGLLGHNHGLEVLLPVASKLPEIEFVIVGDGTERALLERRAQELSLPNLHFEGYCADEERIRSYYREADILITHIKDTSVLNRAVIPAKVFEYMATGKPMISAGRGVTERLLTEADCAEIATPEDPDSIVEALTNLLEDPARRQMIGNNARRAVSDRYLRERMMADFARRLTAYLERSEFSRI